MLWALVAAAALASAGESEPGLWLTSPDRGHSIRYPKGWPYPGVARSISPTGMAHQFFLTTPDGEIGMDVASSPGEREASEYLELARLVAAGGASKLKETRLAGGGTLRYFTATETGPSGANRFVQGVVSKKSARYYVTVTSPKRFPSKGEWSEIRAALGSLRPGSSTVGGRPVPEAGRALQLDLGPDGSVLELREGWRSEPWGYIQRNGLGRATHSLRKGSARAEIAGVSMSDPAKPAIDLTNGLAESYSSRSGGRRVEVQTVGLDNGLKVHALTTGQPNVDGRRQLVFEGFFKRKPKEARIYYFVLASPIEETSEESFRALSTEFLSMLGTLKW